jgi:hypothetical protein
MSPRTNPRKTGTVGYILLCRCGFRLGARLIGSQEKRRKPMQITNFYLGAGLIGKPERFSVSLDAPTSYAWAPD